jgi:eukaryotic-like serine/threonine-protein kinase
MPLEPGATFDRYLVEALLGEGGMGQVYRVHDPRLHRSVALKVITGAGGADVAARLLREARAAAAIDHPHAVAIFDVGEFAGTPFLAMELVDGTTLRRYVGDPSVSVARRLHWLVAIARALAAAHNRGIVHRDIKPENVMVRSDGFVKVLDFGIARATTRPETPSFGERVTEPIGAIPPVPKQVTGGSVRVGTPLYASPEQMRGESVDGRSDQFSWGVVAWELLTGELPWSIGLGGWGEVSQIESKDPALLEGNVPEVSSAVAAVVARAMRKRASERFETTEQLVTALEAALETTLSLEAFRPAADVSPSVSPMAHTLDEARTRTLRARRSLALGAVTALACVAGVVAWRVHAVRAADDVKLSLVAAGRRPAVAVVGATPLGDLLATDLASGDRIRVVPRDVTARIDPTAAQAPPSIARLGDLAGADYVLVSASDTSGGRLRVTVSIEGMAGSGRAPKSARVSAEGDPSDLAGTVARAGDEVRRTLVGAPLATDEVAALRAALPRSTLAAESYARGLACLRRSDYVAARDAFEQSISAEDGFALAHFQLSRTLRALHSDPRSLAEATRALELSQLLGREQRLVIEAQHAAAAKDWAGASEVYRTLFGFFPDNLDYGLSYVRAQVFAGKRSDVFSTLDRLRSVPRTSVDGVRIDLLEAFVAAKVADIRRRLAAATRAKEKADALGVASLAADARVDIAQAHEDLGEMDLGLRDLDEARALYEKLGDKSGMANVYRAQAAVAVLGGDVQRAVALDEQALVLAREAGDQYTVAGMLTDRALLQQHAGDFGAAETGFDEARGVYESIQDDEGVGHNTGNAAEARLALGELEGTRAAFERALAIHRRIGMKRGIAEQTLNVGSAAFFEGDFDSAARWLADALELNRALGAAEETWETLSMQGRLLHARGDSAGARSAYEEAASVASEAKDVDAGAEIDVARARLELDDGRTGDAVMLARGALDRFVASGLPHDEALARAVLVRAYARSRALDDAERESGALAAVLPRCQLFEARFEAQLAASELAWARGDRAVAVRLARGARDEAQKAGFVPLASEAQRLSARFS